MRDELFADPDPERESSRPRAALSPWPLLVVLVAACLCWFGFHTWQLQREYRGLLEIRASSEGPLDQARKRRAQLESIMRRTFELAQKGNPGATLILQELARRGVTINPPPATGAPAPPK